MDATTSSTSSPPQHGASESQLPHTLSFINNVQTAIAAIEQRLEHNPSAQPPPPQRNEYPAQQVNNRDRIYTASVKHLEQPVLLPQHDSASSLTPPTVDADAVLSPQSTFSSLAIDEAVSVTSDYQVSTTFGSPVPRQGVPTTRSIADIVQHFESNALSRDISASNNPSSTSIAPIVDRFESEHRLSNASKPASAIAPIVEQFQHPTNSKSSVSFAHQTDTVITASKENTSATEDEIELSSVGATVDPSEFEFFPDEPERLSHRALSAASFSKSERDTPQNTSSPPPPLNVSDAPAQVSANNVDEFEGSTVNVDALSESLHVNADNLEVTDESVAHAIKTLDTYSMAVGIEASKHEAAESAGDAVSAKEHYDSTASAHGSHVARGGETHQEDISTPIDDSSSEEQESESGVSMPHAASQVSSGVHRAQPSVPEPMAQNSHIAGVESNSRSFTITSTTTSSHVEDDHSRLERASDIETVITGTTNEIRDSENGSPALATEEYSTLNPSLLQDGLAAGEPRLSTTVNSTVTDIRPITSSKVSMAAVDSSSAEPTSPVDIGSVANVSNVRKAQSYDEPSPAEPVAAVPPKQTVWSTAEDASEQVGDTSDGLQEITEMVATVDIDGMSDSALEAAASSTSMQVGRGTGADAESGVVHTTPSTMAGAVVHHVGTTVAQKDTGSAGVQGKDLVLEAKEAPEALLQTRSTESESMAPTNEQTQNANPSQDITAVRPETRRTLTPSRIPRRSHNQASPANSSASSIRMERLESESEANPRRRLAGSMTPTSLSPGSRIMSSRLPPSRASSSGTLTPLSRSAATSPKGMSPLSRRVSSSSQQQADRAASLANARNSRHERKGIKLPRVAELSNARNRDRSSTSPGSRLPRGSTFNGVSPVRSAGSSGQKGSARRFGTTSTPVTPSNRPRASPQGMGDLAPLHEPLRRTLSFNNNRRATLSPSNLRGAAASSRLQEMRAPGAGAARRATLSETGKPPRHRVVTVPEPFNLTGAALQAKALKQLEEQKRRREEADRRRRVFRARPMPDFSRPSPRPFL
ncbi:hypothetical protein FGB62_128g013 [Gracilaria domingensis]|nr:hypothetical protein FGB62_128g013 [Gracilaria domingensis]